MGTSMAPTDANVTPCPSCTGRNPTAIAVTAAQRPSSKSIGNGAYKAQESVTR